MAKDAKMNTYQTDLNDIYMPEFFRLNKSNDREKFERLVSLDPSIFIYDEIEGQLQELIKILFPSRKLKSEEYPPLIEAHLKGQLREEYGVWVYYPWSKKLVHILDEDEFTMVRTNRNHYKITQEEEKLLRTKKIGIIGLSVGQSIALTIAMERICGELRLADFDTAELSNLNRIRTGLYNLGLKKTIIAAREIFEIDPFLKIIIYNDGLSEENINDFFTKNGKLDLLVEECDGLDIKILSRIKAKSLGIPVVMDTNDRGMLDIERYDLEPGRPLLHGLIEGLDPQKMKGLTNEDKVPYLLKMSGGENFSTRLKASMMEVEQSIPSWPQLASSVVLGGALVTDTARRILLNQHHDSGRYYVDFDKLIEDKEQDGREVYSYTNPYLPLEKLQMKNIVDKYFRTEPVADFHITDEQLNKIIDAAIVAPSPANNQPWKWYYSNGVLFLFHDKQRSWSWVDYESTWAHVGFGTTLENVHLQSALLNLKDKISVFPIEHEPLLIAAIRFEQLIEPIDKMTLSLAENLFARCSNRKLGKRQLLSDKFYHEIEHIINDNSNAKLFYTTKDEDLDSLADIIASCDRIRILQKQTHKELYNEIRWSKKHAEETRDGIELAALDLSPSEVAGFNIAKSWDAISLLAEWDMGNTFKRLSRKAMAAASSMVVIAIPKINDTELVQTGKVLEKLWIYANKEGVSIHPMLAPVFFFSRVINNCAQDLPDHTIAELKDLRENFLKIFPLHMNGGINYTEIFLMKLAVADDMGVKSFRKPKEELFYKD